MEECHKMLTDQINWANPEGDQVRIDVNRPLPLGGPPGQMKAAYYPDFGLELLVPDQMWIDEVCTYDIRKDNKTKGSKNSQNRQRNGEDKTRVKNEAKSIKSRISLIQEMKSK
ncbi:hypothetical protein Tco_0955861 [Tanacetum coccineum]|uniref:Uncharacterized protein n=1 Tax=Tanacetum coccineum TaxID=301880 RepID=A0ABQ5E8C2_9ASTR